ncbi:MAG: hypothetical protein HS126_30580 [Anaerolineales bacterium]|nr:hypothetical protein [Anaerolineales bacterium]
MISPAPPPGAPRWAVPCTLALIFRISDTGIGMTAAQVDRLFEPFSQAENSTTLKYGGTGLRLVISRRLCQMMGGDIIAESEPRYGSTFTVYLPPETQSADLSSKV